MSKLLVDEIESSSQPLVFQSSNTATTVTIDSNRNALVIGPIAIATLTINGHLQAIGNVNVTTSITIGTSGSFNVH